MEIIIKEDVIRLNVICQKNNHKEISYYQKEKEDMKAYYKKWCENNKEKIKESQKNWRDNNKEKIKESQKKWYDNNKEKMKQYNKIGVIIIKDIIKNII